MTDGEVKQLNDTNLPSTSHTEHSCNNIKSPYDNHTPNNARTSDIRRACSYRSATEKNAQFVKNVQLEKNVQLSMLLTRRSDVLCHNSAIHSSDSAPLLVHNVNVSELNIDRVYVNNCHTGDADCKKCVSCDF
jgi:hypothetical protein